MRAQELENDNCTHNYLSKSDNSQRRALCESRPLTRTYSIFLAAPFLSICLSSLVILVLSYLFITLKLSANKGTTRAAILFRMTIFGGGVHTDSR